MQLWFNQGAHSFDERPSERALQWRHFSTKKLLVSIYLSLAAPFNGGA